MGALLSRSGLACAAVAGLGLTDSSFRGDRHGNIASMVHGCQLADARWAVIFLVWM